MKASSFKEKQVVYINPIKLMPLERFLPQPKGAPRAPRGGRGVGESSNFPPSYKVENLGRGGGRGGDRGGRGRGGFTPRGAGGRGGGPGGERTPGTCFKCGEQGH